MYRCIWVEGARQMSQQEQLERVLEKCQGIVYCLRHECHVSEHEAEELGQEMALALCELGEGYSDSYCLQHALYHGVEWLRREFHTDCNVDVRTDPDLVPLINSGRWREVWC